MIASHGSSLKIKKICPGKRPQTVLMMMTMTNILMPPSHVHTFFQCEISMLPLFAILFPPRHFFATLPRARRTNLSPRHVARGSCVRPAVQGELVDRWIAGRAENC
jgi:hypothetical protein